MLSFVKKSSNRISNHSIEIFISLSLLLNLVFGFPNTLRFIYILQGIVIVSALYFKWDNISQMDNLIKLYIFIFSSVVFLSMLVNDNKFVILKTNFRSLFFSISLLLLIAIDKRKFDTIVFNLTLILTTVGIILSIYSFSNYLLGEIVLIEDYFYSILKISNNISFNQLLFSYPSSIRLSSIYSNPNIFGRIMFIILSFNVFGFIKTKNSKNKFHLFFILGFLINFPALIFTQSRTSIFSFFLFLISYVVLVVITKLRNESKLLFVNKKRVLITSMLFFTVVVLVTKFISLKRGVLSTSDRNIVWMATFNIFKSNWFLGIGNGNLHAILSSNYHIGHAHNSYLQILSENGILIFILFIVPFVTSLKNLLSVIFIKIKQTRFYPKEKANNYILPIFTLSLILSIFIHQFFESNLYSFDFLNFITIMLLYHGSEYNHNNLIYKS